MTHVEDSMTFILPHSHDFALFSALGTKVH